MASRKAKPPRPQLGFSLPLAGVPSGATASPPRDCAVSPHAASAVDSSRAEPVDLETFDDYDEAQTVDDVPRLRLADPPRETPRVIVEAVANDRFEVSRLRDNGTTVAMVMWTRSELEELIGRARAALEMTE